MAEAQYEIDRERKAIIQELCGITRSESLSRDYEIRPLSNSLGLDEEVNRDQRLTFA